jgi:transcriptional regulator with XRE-family HTH domain
MENNNFEKLVEQHSDRIIALIERLYEAQGYNQTTFGEKIGWTQAKISHTKNKRNRLSMEYVIKAAAALGVSPTDMLEAVRTPGYDNDDIHMILKLHEAIRNKQKDPSAHAMLKKILQ